MKQLNLTLLLVAIFASSAVFAQDPIKSWKTAGKELIKYYNNSEKNVANLETAKSEIDVAINGIGNVPEKSHAKFYERAGEVYLEVAKNANLGAKNPDAAESAMKYYIKEGEIGKSFQKDAAKNGLATLGQIFVQNGQNSYEAKKYLDAFNSFKNALSCKEQTEKLGGNTLFLITKEDVDLIKLYAGFSAYNGGEGKAAVPYLDELAKAEFDEAQIYSVLFKIHQEEDIEKAFTYLDAGVKRYPGSKALLFDKINYYLTTKQMDKLETDLKKAIEGNPDNAQLPFTLGQVYDDLSGQAHEKGDTEAANKYFQNAYDYYKKTVEIDNNYFDAVYQLGAIHFNKAVRVFKEREEIDYREQKYKDLTVEIEELYVSAWQYFQKAEQIKANDMLLLQAFKEIYARTRNLEHSGKFKERIAAVEADKDAALEPYAHPAQLFKK